MDIRNFKKKLYPFGVFKRLKDIEKISDPYGLKRRLNELERAVAPVHWDLSQRQKELEKILNPLGTLNIVSKIAMPLSEITALHSIADPLKFIEDVDIEGNLNTESVSSETLIVKLDDKNKLQIRRRLNDGAWSYADDISTLPSDIYVVDFSKWKSVIKELEEIINNPNAK